MTETRRPALLNFSQNMGSSVSTAMVALAAVGFGLVPYFAKSLADAGISASAIAFFRFALTALVLSPFLLFDREARSTTFWGMAAGAGMGLGWISYVQALKTVPVSTVGVIYMTYPIFTVLVAWLWFRERPAQRSIIAGLIIFVAAAMAMSPAAIGREAIATMFLALLAPLSFGISINILTNMLIRIPILSRLACVTLGSALGLLPLVASLDIDAVLPRSTTHWWMIGGIAVATALVPQLIYTVFAPRVGAARAAMAGSVELPTMFLIGWLAFGEDIGPLQLLAAAMVLTAIVITPVRQPALRSN